MIRRSILALMALMALGPLTATAQSAESVLAGCRTIAAAKVVGEQAVFPQTFPTGECWGAFGTLQRLIVFPGPGGQPLMQVCAPETSTRTQLIAIYVKYLEDHPAKRNEKFLDIALAALREAFPCGRT